jgi:hypothetical protein
VAFYQGLGGDNKVYSFPLIVAVLFILICTFSFLPDLYSLCTDVFKLRVCADASPAYG